MPSRDPPRIPHTARSINPGTRHAPNPNSFPNDLTRRRALSTSRPRPSGRHRPGHAPQRSGVRTRRRAAKSFPRRMPRPRLDRVPPNRPMPFPHRLHDRQIFLARRPCQEMILLPKNDQPRDPSRVWLIHLKRHPRPHRNPTPNPLRPVRRIDRRKPRPVGMPVKEQRRIF